MNTFINIMQGISLYSIPFLLLAIPLYGQFKKVKVYEVFCDGAKEGFSTAVMIIPYLVAMLVAIGVFRKSGALNIITSFISPVLKPLGIPGEVIPCALMRPLSGGGAQGIMTDLFKTYGTDSFIGRISSVMMGSTETTFYVLAVYFGSVAVKKQRHALAAGLIADLAGFLASVYVVRLVFGI